MQRLRLHVPRRDGALLSVPALDRWRGATAENHRRSRKAEALVGGLSLGELRVLARREVVGAARDYLAQFEGAAPFDVPDESVPFIVGGHQPELFHAGVWVKNFAACGLARREGGVAVHVLIDNDTLKRSQVMTPAGLPESPLLATVPFDRWQGEVPHEERIVLDEGVFERFADSVDRHMADYPFEPILRDLWPATVAARDATSNLGDRLSAGRRRIERELGASALEVPLSRLCRGTAFRTLVADLLLRLDDFVEIHNGAVDAYRRLNKVRSRNHPFPDLERADDWTEAPFWLWSSETPVRRHVFVRRRADRIDLRAGSEEIASLPLTDNDSVASLARGLEMGLGRWKLRPRALMTTLYLRLCVADLFIHGVGGGKYDEVTDEVIRRFFGLEAPAFAILSATALLPADRDRIDEESVKRLERLRRDMVWNPDRHLDDVLRDQDPVAGWIERKFELFEANGAKGQRKSRFLELRALNEQLREYLGAKPNQVERELTDLTSQVDAFRLLQSREFPYCLHPRDSLRELVDPLLRFDY